MSRVDGAREADAAVSERQEEQRPYPLLLLQLLVGDSLDVFFFCFFFLFFSS